jgi:hypothetical protein
MAQQAAAAARTNPMIKATWRKETADAHQEHLQYISKSKGIHLCLLGASLMQGWTGVGVDAWRRAGLPTGDSRPVLHASVNGDGIEHLLWRLSPDSNSATSGLLDVEPRLAEVVCMMIGTNNIECEYVDDMVAGVTHMVRLLVERQPGVSRIIVCGLPLCGNTTQSKCFAYNQSLRTSVLALAPHVEWCDMTQFQCQDALYQPDHIHFSPAGYAQWANVLYQHLYGPTDDSGSTMSSSYPPYFAPEEDEMHESKEEEEEEYDVPPHPLAQAIDALRQDSSNLGAARTLHHILDNVVRHPGVAKFRSLPHTRAKLVDKLGPHFPRALDVLLAAGWCEIAASAESEAFLLLTDEQLDVDTLSLGMARIASFIHGFESQVPAVPQVSAAASAFTAASAPLEDDVRYMTLRQLKARAANKSTAAASAIPIKPIVTREDRANLIEARLCGEPAALSHVPVRAGRITDFHQQQQQHQRVRGGTCASRSQALAHFPLPPRKSCYRLLEQPGYLRVDAGSILDKQ